MHLDEDVKVSIIYLFYHNTSYNYAILVSVLKLEVKVTEVTRSN